MSNSDLSPTANTAIELDSSNANASVARLSAATLSLLVSIFIILTSNGALFRALGERLDLSRFDDCQFVATLYLAMIGAQLILFLLFGVGRLLKPLLIAILIISSVLSYFTTELGVVFDTEMINNTWETILDRNVAEAQELMSMPLLLHVFFFGLLPAFVVLRVRIRHVSFVRAVFYRALYILGTLLILSALVFGNFKSISYITRENRSIRSYVTPVFALDSVRRFVYSNWFKREPVFVPKGEDARQAKPTKRRTIGVMVVGETSRADHWSLDGYQRETNPLLAKRRILNYPDMWASGTSTARSVPCMFSFLTKSSYSKSGAANQSNVLDVIAGSGAKVLWVDNNSSSKGVCDRLGLTFLEQIANPSDPRSSNGQLYDEVLVDHFDDFVGDTESDILIVLHTMGSHGPAYYRRYPAEFDRFVPSCQLDSPQQCDDESLINAYDNTILYTDYVLNLLIETLEARSELNDTFLFYVSDHGESLGENGIYLHGLPDFLAPDSQTHVPAFLWLSDEYIGSHQLDYAGLEQRVSKTYSHDFVSHTLLRLLDVETKEYQPALDLLNEGLE